MTHSPPPKSVPETSDLAFGASLACTGLALLVLILSVKTVDYSFLEEVPLEKLPPRMVRLIIPKKPITPTPEQKPVTTNTDQSKPSQIENETTELASRLARAKQAVQKEIKQTQQRITKASVLKVLTGKGPGARIKNFGNKIEEAGFGDWGELDKKLQSIEGLTKIKARKGTFNREGGDKPGTKGEESMVEGISDLVASFKEAERGQLAKIGTLDFDRPQLLEDPLRPGGRTPEEIASFISTKRTVVRLVYEERLKRSPGLEGKVTVIMTIEPDGRISKANVVTSETTLMDRGLHQILIKRILRWRLSPAKGGPMEIKTPFLFKAVK